jgi:hypothetical protein
MRRSEYVVVSDPKSLRVILGVSGVTRSPLYEPLDMDALTLASVNALALPAAFRWLPGFRLNALVGCADLASSIARDEIYPARATRKPQEKYSATRKVSEVAALNFVGRLPYNSARYSTTVLFTDGDMAKYSNVAAHSSCAKMVTTSLN